MARWILPALAIGGVGLLAASVSASRSGVPSSLPALTRILTQDGRRVLMHLPAGRTPQTRVVLYLHGNGARIDDLQHTIVPALDAADHPPILVVPQLAADGSPGTLGQVGAVAHLLEGSGAKELDVLAHSGGYRAAAAAVEHGGLPVRSVGLLDALYGELDTFERFALSGGTRHLVNV